LSATSCSLTTGNAYCVEENYGNPPIAPSSSSSVRASSSISSVHPTTFLSSVRSTTSSSPAPTSSAGGSCTEYYTAQSGDGCYQIATSHGLTLDQFYALNPSINTQCTNLYVGEPVCVAGSSSPPPTSSSSTHSITSSAGNGISTPAPTQAGMVGNCDAFYDVQSGDGCYQIAAQFNIALTDFYAWNPAVGSSCSGLFAGYYVCVGVIGSTPASSSSAHSSSTSPGNGISTPLPTQAGMVSNCDQFYDVVSGDGCYNIAASYGIALSDFYAWNPAVGTSCQSLFAGYYVCVGLAPPSPTQAGIASNCNKYYLVQSGDGCYNIAAANGITLANFYSWNPAVGSSCQTLYAGYYVCIGTH
jgi:LysM repeat protein